MLPFDHSKIWNGTSWWLLEKPTPRLGCNKLVTNEVCLRSDFCFYLASLSCWTVRAVEAEVWFWTLSSLVHLWAVMAALSPPRKDSQLKNLNSITLLRYKTPPNLRLPICPLYLLITPCVPKVQSQHSLLLQSGFTHVSCDSPWLESGWNPRAHPHFVLRFLWASRCTVSRLVVPRAADIPGLCSQPSLSFNIPLYTL